MVTMWVCIALPLSIGVYFINAFSSQDAAVCVNTFLESEGRGLNRYIGLQFEHVKYFIEFAMSRLSDAELANAESTQKALADIQKGHSELVTINVYDDTGTCFASSTGIIPENLNTREEKIRDIDDKYLYFITQDEETSDIVVKFIMVRKFEAPEKKSLFFEFIIKWNRFEEYLQNMYTGIFPRMFYIISPDCRRYISLNSLPAGLKSARNVVALGLHLAAKIKSLKDGISTVQIENFLFRTFKERIIMPPHMDGNELFVVIASDCNAFDVISVNLKEGIPLILMILVISWMLICASLARFYSKTRDQLEISTTIADSTPLAIVIFQTDNGKIKQINISATTLIRLVKEEIDTVNMWDIFVSEGDKNYVLNAIISNISIFNYEVLIQSFGGANFWTICSASPIEIEEQQHIVLAILDINRRKEIEKKLANNAEFLEKEVLARTADLEIKAKELEESNENLNQARAAADKANTAKSKFITNMSNELKTPINAIIAYSEILREEAIDRKDSVSADDLRKIIGSAKHQLSLIDEILDLSKIEEGKTLMYFENVDIADMIKDVEGVTMPLIANNDNSFFLEYPKDLGTMYTDATKLRQCLLNLISNAAKFTEFGRITLRVVPVVKDEVDLLEFSVADTGSGMSPKKVANLFKAVQEDGTPNTSLGLGLALTKKYAEFFGGTIRVESTEGFGSKFTLCVPRITTATSNEFLEVKNDYLPKEQIIEVVDDLS
jgi:PAS domain S-box-containing protein